MRFMNNNIVYKKTEEYVASLFERMHDPDLIYHNLNHTRCVVERAKEIAGHYHLSEADMMVLYVAAWFHDTGHLFTEASRHEEKSVELMKEFITDYITDPELINKIEESILATREPRHPANLLQQILCDADTYHFGTKEFKETNKQVRKEYILREGEIDKREWDKRTLDMLELHQYYTTYCQGLLDDKKKSNMKKLKKKIENSEDANDSLVIRETDSLTTKGIQTMLRLTSENHLKLS